MLKLVIILLSQYQPGRPASVTSWLPIKSHMRQHKQILSAYVACKTQGSGGHQKIVEPSSTNSCASQTRRLARARRRLCSDWGKRSSIRACPQRQCLLMFLTHARPFEPIRKGIERYPSVMARKACVVIMFEQSIKKAGDAAKVATIIARHIFSSALAKNSRKRTARRTGLAGNTICSQIGPLLCPRRCSLVEMEMKAALAWYAGRS
jgi:hypothetical protein